MKMSKYVHLLVPGHGGIDEEGNYTTAPSKMKTFNDGSVVYEGVMNREICRHVGIVNSLSQYNVDLETLYVDTHEDVILDTRIADINDLYNTYKKKGKELLLWEIHNNAFDGTAEGFEVYSTSFVNFGDVMANRLVDNVGLETDMIIRGHKKANFKVIYNVKPKAVLIEWMFFDNKKEIQKYYNNEGMRMMAHALLKTMKDIDNGIY